MTVWNGILVCLSFSHSFIDDRRENVVGMNMLLVVMVFKSGGLKCMPMGCMRPAKKLSATLDDLLNDASTAKMYHKIFFLICSAFLTLCCLWQ